MANVINSLKLGDGTYVFTTPYATCNTAAATAAKVATITPSSNFSLEKGARVAVQFDNANTAGSPTLNVNNTGAKAIYFKNAALTSSNYWSAKQIIDFIYDGNYWVCSAVVTDNNTDTKNTAGSMNTSNKIYLIGATSQAANSVTYSHDTAYVGTDGCLYSNSKKVATVGDNNTFTGNNTFSGTNTFEAKESNPITISYDNDSYIILTGRKLEVFDALDEQHKKKYDATYHSHFIMYKVIDYSGEQSKVNSMKLFFPEKEGTNAFTLATTDDISNASYFNNEILFMSPAQFTQGIKDSASGSIISLPGKGGTFALTSDIDVKLAGDNTFTGLNTFTNPLLCNNGIMSSTIHPGGGHILTVPKKNGTIATTDDIDVKAAGNNTFTGSNTFTFDETETTGSLYRTLIDQHGVSVGAGPRSGIMVDTTYGINNIRYSDSATTATYTYTFPNKSGTFALTKDLPDTSNFVTLSGAQTISGHKTFNNHITLPNGPDGYLEVGSWKFFGYSLSNNINKTSLSFPSDKNGTIALTSDIPIKTATLSGTTLSITLS